MKTIDLHTHGIAGRDSRSADPDEYLRLAESYKAHGTDGFLVTLFPDEVANMRAVLGAVGSAMSMQKDGAPGASIIGAHLEGPFVNPARAGALGGDAFAAPSADLLKRLLDGFEDIVRVITVAPELPGALGLIEYLAGTGIRVNMGHSDASFDEARDGKLAGAVGVTHLFNAMSGMHHRRPGLAAYALADDGLYVELIADMAHVHPAILKLALRCKPPERVILISDSLGAAKTLSPDDTGPLYMPDKRTLAGGGISLSDALKNIVLLGIPEKTASAFVSNNPLSYLGPP